MPDLSARPDRIQQAGAIAVRYVDGAPQVLLVKSRKDPRLWIFPKGHLESGENLEAAAMRELREEAGVVGEVIARAGALEFQSGDEPVRVDYFVVRALGEEVADEDRERRWYGVDEAIEVMPFADARELLAAARPLLEATTS